MSDHDHKSSQCSNIDNSESSLHRILKNCANFQSSESLLIEDFNDVSASSICSYYKMLSTHSPHSTPSSNVSTSSYASDESFGENILEENGRISLAYENLRTIPKRIAEKFAAHTKCLDLSYNNFQNLSFLSFFEALHTLILDRNGRLDVNTLPYLPNLKILWINNCDISNVADWIQRIRMQCPALEQLSVMGNPGIKASFSFCTLIAANPSDPATLTSIVSDYREYILNVLPNLEYLDGVACCPATAPPSSPPTRMPPVNGRVHPERERQRSFKVPSTTVTNGTKPFLNGGSFSATHNNSNHHPDKGFITSRNNSNHNNKNNNMKNAPALSFKEIFRLKRRKKSYQSSSIN